MSNSRDWGEEQGKLDSPAVSTAQELWSADDDETWGLEPFDLPGTEKLGILGGKGVGKSYLFNAMVYRTYASPQAGALSRYLQGVRLFRRLAQPDRRAAVDVTGFVKNYMDWLRLPQTSIVTQEWYRLRLKYRVGLLGNQRSGMDVDFFDGSGEFFESPPASSTKRFWRSYSDTRVVAFCLPLWAAFPGSRLSREDWQLREDFLAGFERVVRHYEDTRALHKKTHPVSSILVLTMADDPRGALWTLYERWILPYLESPQPYLRSLRSGSGIIRYLVKARRISEALHKEFRASRDPRVSSIPGALDFGGRPWIIPTSAISGNLLDRLERERAHPDERPLPPPVPVHVELPILVALCERSNALM